MAKSSNEFASKVGLIAATIGSAVGLGSIWRFPAETQANGGAAFLLLYIICIFILGIPVMLAEFSLGRAARSDAFGDFKKLAPGSAWWLIGVCGISASYIIGCYYMVVGGWTLEYLWESISGGLFDGIGGTSVASLDRAFDSKMEQYICSPWMPSIFTAIVIIVNFFILDGGVQKGIERLSNIMMPLLFIVILVLCFVTLSLPNASEGVKWFVNPDFSKITPMTVINALGQTFFSLSLGMGILLTYAAYYPADTKLLKTSVIVSLMSLMIAVMMGFVIFPAVFSFGLESHSLAGTTLVFQTLPEVFAKLPATRVWAILFFALLFMAALTSTVSIMEVSIAFIRDRFGFSRRSACLIALLPLFLFSTICSLSFSTLSDFRIFGLTVFELFDTFSTNILLPITSIGVCVFLGWFAPKNLLRDQLTNGGMLKGRYVGIISFIIRWIAPLMIAAILVSVWI